MGDECEVSDLTACCFEESLEKISSFLKGVDWKTERSVPLHWAIKRRTEDRAQVVALLLDAGSPVDGQSLYLCERFDPSLLDLLPDPKTNSVEDKKSIEWALLDAARCQRSVHLERFLNLGASPDAKDYFHGFEGWTALHHICNNCDLDSFKIIFQKLTLDQAYLLNDKGSSPLALLEDSGQEKQKKFEYGEIRRDLIQRLQQK